MMGKIGQANTYNIGNAQDRAAQPTAWESVPSGPVMRPDLRGEVSASDRRDRPSPGLMAANGPVVSQGPH